MPKKIGAAFSFYTTCEGQYEIKVYVVPHNETDTGVLNKNVVTVTVTVTVNSQVIFLKVLRMLLFHALSL